MKKSDGAIFGGVLGMIGITSVVASHGITGFELFSSSIAGLFFGGLLGWIAVYSAIDASQIEDL